MKILFSTFGSLGDIHPYIALAREAKARGHRPVLATAPKYGTKIENQGLEFRSVRPDLPSEAEFAPLAQKVMHGQSGPEFLFKELLVPSLRQNYADLLEAAADADIVITHPAALAGPLAASKLGKKWLSSALAPISTWSIYDPPVPPTFSYLDQWRVFGPLWGIIFKAMGRAVTAPWVREVQKLRIEKEIDLRGHPIFEGQHSPYGTLALFSSHFAPPQRDWPLNTVATGFCFYDSDGYDSKDHGTSPSVEVQPSHEWQAWLENGEPPIVFTLGSSAVFNANDFLAISQKEARRLGRRAVFLTGGVAKLAQPLSESELAIDYAPFSELFPLARFVVHQGGIGTTAQALRAGVPQMIVPHAHDQPDNAGRITRLGLGRSVSLDAYKRGQVGREFDFFEANTHTLSQKAREMGDNIRAEDGPRVACETIERLFAAEC